MDAHFLGSANHVMSFIDILLKLRECSTSIDPFSWQNRATQQRPKTWSVLVWWWIRGNISQKIWVQHGGLYHTVVHAALDILFVAFGSNHAASRDAQLWMAAWCWCCIAPFLTNHINRALPCIDLNFSDYRHTAIPEFWTSEPCCRFRMVTPMLLIEDNICWTCWHLERRLRAKSTLKKRTLCQTLYEVLKTVPHQKTQVHWADWVLGCWVVYIAMDWKVERLACQIFGPMVANFVDAFPIPSQTLQIWIG